VSEPITFAAAGFDRAAERRTDTEWLQAALADPRARVLAVTAAGVPLGPVGDPRPVTLLVADALEAVGAEPSDLVLLGVDDDGTALFGLDAEDADEAALLQRLGADTRMTYLRDVAVRLSAMDAGLLAYAQALLAWQRTHRFCGRCGGPTEVRDGGHARFCPRDGTMNHPRTDPVVIAVVSDGDRMLMGRQPSWPAGRYSALAGFVEPGESLEDAVRREIDEEAGIAVGDIRYHSSQPWPFPGSLMCGFIAEYAGGAAHTRDDELEDVGWFGREEIRAATAEDGWETQGDGATGLLLPPRIAIARRLIESWLDD
jgi:NAD+ diphosphatase